MRLFGRILLDWLLPVAAVLAVAIPNLNHPPAYDEVLHYVAAIGLIEHGDFSVAQGTYPRAGLYSAMVAASFQAFGVSDVAARIPSVVASVVWVLLLYGFLHKVHSRSAAWIGLAIFVSAPSFILITQMCRFYTLHGMTFFLAAIALFAAVRSRTIARRAIFAFVCVFFLAISLHLQVTTLIGIAALATWLIAISVPTLFALSRQTRARGIAVVVFFTAAIVAAYFIIPWQHIMDLATQTTVWARERAGSYFFYARSLGTDFGFTWFLFPFLAIVAYRRLPEVVWYACVIFAVVFILHSVAGQKADRYMAYVFPFLCIVAGIAFAELIQGFRKIAIEVSRRTAGEVVPESAGGAAIVAVCIAFVILINPNTSYALAAVFNPRSSTIAEYHAREADWRKVDDLLARHTREAPTLVASSGTKALFYVGYYDYELNTSVAHETESGEEFGIDDRTGGLAISELESLKRVVACSPEGLAVLDEPKWRRASHIAPDVADYIEQTMQAVPVPADANLRVYTWTSPPNDSAACDTMPRSRSTMSR